MSFYSKSAARTRAVVEPAPHGHGRSGGPLVWYGRLLGPLLAGYLLFDRAFAYLHVPGVQIYVGEMALAVGLLAALVGTGYLRIPIRDEPILSLLAAFVLWGLIRFVPGLSAYGMDAVRDAALWYYCLFAFLVVGAIAKVPDLVERLIGQLGRLVPWLLLWLPIAVLLAPFAESAPEVPDSSVSILSHKPDPVAIVALLVLGSLWLFQDGRTARSRCAWSLVALLVIALVGTQNRGGLLGAGAGMIVGLAFVRDRARLIAKMIAVIALGLCLASLLPLRLGFVGDTGREFSASQLSTNVLSIAGGDEPGDLDSTVADRQDLWSRVFEKQVRDGRLADGAGFGPNLAVEVGVYNNRTDSLRSPHNSHVDVLARMGLVGLALWIALWIGWYWRLVAGCGRLAALGLFWRRNVAVLCLSTTTAILVAALFDPQLEGPQVAALLWTVFGVGVAATSFRDWSGNSASVATVVVSSSSPRHHQTE